MAKDETTKAVSLKDIDIRNLPEFKDALVKQQKLVTQNPFVEITDVATYDAAKRARTSLKTARTDIEKQDKFIASLLTGLRKDSKELKDEIIALSQVHETKQQEEVTRWEDIKKAEKEEEDRVERERIDGLKKIISDFKEEYIAKIKVATLEEIRGFDEEIRGSERDVFEYEDWFVAAKADLFVILAEKHKTLDDAETQRLEDERLKAEKERLEKLEEERLEKERLSHLRTVKGSQRMDKLSEVGFSKDFDYLADMPDAEWNELLEIKTEAHRIFEEDKKKGELEKERIAKEEVDKLKADQEKLKLEQESLKFEKRKLVLFGLGLEYNEEGSIFFDDSTSIQKDTVKTYTDDQFDTYVVDYKEELKRLKHAIEEEVKFALGQSRQSDLSKVGAEYPIEELSKMEQADFDELLSKECKNYEAFLDNEQKLQEKKEEENQKRIEALKPDIQKLNEFLENMISILPKLPEMNTEEGKKVSIGIAELYDQFEENAKELIQNM